MKYSGTIFFTILLIIVSCQDESQSLKNQMQEKIKFLEANYAYINEHEWNKDKVIIENMILRYENLKGGLNEKEREKINQLIGKYHAITTKRMIRETSSEINDLSNRVEGFINEFEK
jgi:hypothetical protein